MMSTFPLSRRITRRGASLARIAALLALASASPASAQRFFNLGKEQLLRQTSPTGVAPNPVRGPYLFTLEAPIRVVLTLPTGATAPIVLTLNPRDGELEHDRAYRTKFALDAAFPPGTHRMSGPGIPVLALSLPDSFPATTPRITTVTNGTWTSAGLLYVNPSQPCTINFNVFSDYAAPGATGYMATNVWGFTEQRHLVSAEAASRPVFDLPSQPSPITSITIPANTLGANRLYEVEIEFHRWPTVDTTTLPGDGVATIAARRLHAFIAAQTNNTPPPAPTIVAQPASRTASLGGSTTFTLNATVPAANRGNVLFWYKDGIEIDTVRGAPRIVRSADGQTLTINDLTATDAGEYRAEIVSAGGIVATDPARLTVALPPPPRITTHPASVAVVPGGSATLTVAATGDATYQWRRDGQPIAGATGASYTIASVGAETAGQYDAVATNAYGSATTTPATVALEERGLDETYQPPVFATDPTRVQAARVVALSDGSWLHFFNSQSLTTRMTGGVVKYTRDGQVDGSFRFPAEAGNTVAICAAPDGAFFAASVTDRYEDRSTLQRERRHTVARYRSDGTLDPAWPPLIWSEASGDSVRALTLPTDGRLIATGFFTNIGGSGRQGVARFNAGGGLDDTFGRVTLTRFPNGGGVWSRAVQDSAGRIYLGGDFSAVNGQPRPGLARLTADGQLDNGFVPTGFTRIGSLPVRGIVPFDDGTVVIGGRLNVPGESTTALLRLTATGSRDPAAPVTSFSDDYIYAVRDMVKLSETHFAVASNSLVVFDADLDSVPSAEFQQPRFFLEATSNEGFALDVTPDGDFLVAGAFDTVRYYHDDTIVAPRAALARFGPAGELRSFAPAPLGSLNQPTAVAPLANGRLLVRTGALGGSAAPLGYAHLEADGSPAGPVAGLPATFVASGLARYADGRVMVWDLDAPGGVTLVRLMPDGTRDPSLPVTGNAVPFGQLFILPDGRGLAAIDTIVRNTYYPQDLRRFNVNGTEDTSFAFVVPDIAASATRAAPTAADTSANRPGPLSEVTDLQLRVLAANAAGSFYVTYLGADGQVKVARHLASGARDTAFAVVSFARLPTIAGFVTITDSRRPGAPASQVRHLIGPPAVLTGAVLPDGSLLLGGKFTSANGQPAPGVVWLTSTGARDPRMAALGAGAEWAAGATATEFPRVEAIARDALGRITIAGTFERWNNQPAPGLVRLDADGTANPFFGQPLQRIAALPGTATLTAAADGTVYLTGPYRGLGEPYTRQIWRLSPIRTRPRR